APRSLQALRVATLVGKRHLAKKRRRDAAWAQLRTTRASKAVGAGKPVVVVVVPTSPTQDWSRWGARAHIAFGAPAGVSLLRAGARRRPERGQKRPVGRAGPSWSRGGSRGAEASISRL